MKNISGNKKLTALSKLLYGISVLSAQPLRKGAQNKPIPWRMSIFEKNIKYTIHYFPIVHNALCLPPKFCINYCCEILLGGLHIPKSIPQQ